MTSAMNDTHSTGSRSATADEETWPYRFKAHDFGVACYSTYGCHIRYAGQQIDRDDTELSPSSESIGPDYKDNLSAGRTGIRNFPPPATIDWRSKDGTQLHAEIDIAAIFKDELILHEVPESEVDFNTSVGTPGIIFEVNDRTINVYMRTVIPTKKLQIPGNQYSRYRDDLMLAYTHTY